MDEDNVNELRSDIYRVQTELEGIVESIDDGEYADIHEIIRDVHVQIDKLNEAIREAKS